MPCGQELVHIGGRRFSRVRYGDVVCLGEDFVGVAVYFRPAGKTLALRRRERTVVNAEDASHASFPFSSFVPQAKMFVQGVDRFDPLVRKAQSRDDEAVYRRASLCTAVHDVGEQGDDVFFGQSVLRIERGDFFGVLAV